MQCISVVRSFVRSPVLYRVRACGLAPPARPSWTAVTSSPCRRACMYSLILNQATSVRAGMIDVPSMSCSLHYLKCSDVFCSAGPVPGSLPRSCDASGIRRCLWKKTFWSYGSPNSDLFVHLTILVPRAVISIGGG